MNEKKKLSSISKQNKTRKTKKEKGERVGFFSGGRGDGQNLLFCPKFQLKFCQGGQNFIPMKKQENSKK